MTKPWPFPKPEDDGAADHLRAGLSLPDIALPSTRGVTKSLARLKGRNVVFVYPYTGREGLPDPPGWNDIPGAHGSTPQAECFGKIYPQIHALGVDVFGVSSQDTAHQRELLERLALPFEILSDTDFAFQKALDLPTFTAGEHQYLKRLTLIINDGVIIKTFYPVHPPDRHPIDLLHWLIAHHVP